VCEGSQNIRKSYVNKINYFLLNFPNAYEIIIEKKCLFPGVLPSSVSHRENLWKNIEKGLDFLEKFL